MIADLHRWARLFAAFAIGIGLAYSLFSSELTRLAACRASGPA